MVVVYNNVNTVVNYANTLGSNSYSTFLLLAFVSYVLTCRDVPFLEHILSILSYC